MQAKSPPFDARGDTHDASDSADTRFERRRGQTTIDFAVGISVFLIAVAVVFSFTPTLTEPFAESGTEDTVIANRAASQLVGATLASPDQPYVLNKSCTIAFFAPENSDGKPGNDQDLNGSNDGDRSDMYDISGDSVWTGSSCNFALEYLHQRLGVAGIDDDGNIDRSLSPGLQIEIYGNTDDEDDGDQLLCLDANERAGPDGSAGPEGDDPDIKDPIVEADEPGVADHDDNDPYNDGDPCDAADNDHDVPLRVGEDPPEETGSVVVARRVVTIDGIRATVFVRVW